jgi:hypothetical protein
VVKPKSVKIPRLISENYLEYSPPDGSWAFEILVTTQYLYAPAIYGRNRVLHKYYPEGKENFMKNSIYVTNCSRAYVH